MRTHYPHSSKGDRIMKGGVDHGFCFSYWSLSYRRKFIRTMWQFPFFVALVPAAIAFDWRPLGFESPWEHIALAVLVAVGFPVQLYFTHRKWQQEQAGDSA